MKLTCCRSWSKHIYIVLGHYHHLENLYRNWDTFDLKKKIRILNVWDKERIDIGDMKSFRLANIYWISDKMLEDFSPTLAKI